MTGRHGAVDYSQIGNGGVLFQFGNYTAQDSDSWALIVFENGSPVVSPTYTLPTSPPSDLWRVKVLNLGSTELTIDPGALQINAALGTVRIVAGGWCEIFTDGVNWFVTYSGATATPVSPTTTTNRLIEVPLFAPSSPTKLVLSFIPATCAVSGYPDLGLYRNGVRLMYLDPGTPGYVTLQSGLAEGYSIVGSVITLTTAADSFDHFEADYVPTSASLVTPPTPPFGMGGGTQVFTQPQTGGGMVI